MNLFKKSVFLLAVIFASGKLYSQIGGLSGSKLISYTVDVVDDKKMEFEPAFYHFASSRYWDADGNLQNIYTIPDSVRHITGMGFRFTYGMADKFEAGFSFATDLKMGFFGAKYIVFQKNKIGAALITGINVPLGNQTYDKRIRLAESSTLIGVGGITTVEFNDNFSLDVNAQYMFYLTETVDNDRGKIFVSADAGYYVFNHTLQLIGSTAFSCIKNNEGSHQVFTINTGATVETGKNFIIVIGVPFDVYGKNEAKNIGFTFALTLTFD